MKATNLLEMVAEDYKKSKNIINSILDVMRSKLWTT